jgi:hypothetical protein
LRACIPVITSKKEITGRRKRGNGREVEESWKKRNKVPETRNRGGRGTEEGKRTFLVEDWISL